VSGRSGAGLEAGGFEKVRELLRIIEEFDEMQLAQKRLKTSSMSILAAGGSHVLGIWLCC
jgi:hypothetical protein